MMPRRLARNSVIEVVLAEDVGGAGEGIAHKLPSRLIVTQRPQGLAEIVC